MAELLAESTQKTHSFVESLLDSIRNGVLVDLAFLLTVVVINGLKDTGFQVIFSIEYLSIAIVLLLLSTVAIWASRRDARSRFEQSGNATADLLRRMYAHVMISAEIDREIVPTVEVSRAYIKRQTRKYQRLWLVFALLVASAFWIGHLAFGEDNAPSAPNAGDTGRAVAHPQKPEPAKSPDLVMPPLAAPSNQCECC